MKILRASHLGMCFGVRDAIALARDQATRGPLTIYGDLVHNENVLKDLQRRGIRVVAPGDPVTTRQVLVTAHGASEKTMTHLREQGLQVREATCPLVHFAHRAVAQLVRDGFHPVIVGQRNHVEVRGLTGDLNEFDVVLTEEDIDRLPERLRFGVAAQTTQPLARVEHLVPRLRLRFRDAQVRFVDTICHPTKQRQGAASDLARRCEVVVVVGGAHSNNTRELVATCEGAGTRVHHVQGPDDLRSAWFEGISLAGLTAGTSTPDEIIDAVEDRLHQISARIAAPELAAVS